MAGKFRGYFIILYYYETDEPVTICESVDELRSYLGYKNNASTRTAISHFIRGDIKYLTDEKARRYTLAKIKDDGE